MSLILSKILQAKKNAALSDCGGPKFISEEALCTSHMTSVTQQPKLVTTIYSLKYLKSHIKKYIYIYI